MKKENDTHLKAIGQMAFTLKIEEAAFTAIGIYFLSRYNLGLPLWAWILLFFSPDVSMIAYGINPRIGAYCYNLFHHRAIAVILVATGMLMASNVWIAAGILLFAHSSFDRMMGYGLKFTDDFKHTSLGWMGRKEVSR